MSPPAEIAAWLACAAFVLMLLNGAWKLKGNITGESSRRELQQPFVVEMAKQFPSRDELHKVVDENDRAHRDLFAKLGGIERGHRSALDEQIRSIRAELREDVQGIHLRINSIEKSMGGVETAVTLQNQNTAALAASIREMMARRA